MSQIQVQHFSDLLCVWAYVAQARVDELSRVFGDEIQLDYHFVDVFGDVPGRTVPRWEKKGGLQAYAKHVEEVVAKFDHVSVHPEVWTKNTPISSVACHHFLHAVQLVAGSSALEKVAWEMRMAFFARAEEICDSSSQFAFAEQAGVSREELEKVLRRGEAMANLSRDWRMASEQGVKVSPTLLFNEGRQMLRGNVGYKVIEANVHELLQRQPVQHSWC